MNKEQQAVEATKTPISGMAAIYEMYDKGVTRMQLLSIVGSTGNIRSINRMTSESGDFRYEVTYGTNEGVASRVITPGMVETPIDVISEAAKEESKTAADPEIVVGKKGIRKINKVCNGYTIDAHEGTEPIHFESRENFICEVARLSECQMAEAAEMTAKLDDAYYAEIGGSTHQVVEAIGKAMGSTLLEMSVQKDGAIFIEVHPRTNAKQCNETFDLLLSATMARGWKPRINEARKWSCSRIVAESDARKRAFKAGIPYPAAHFMAKSTDAVLAPSVGGQKAQEGEQKAVPAEKQPDDLIKVLMKKESVVVESNPTTRAYAAGIPMAPAAVTGHSTDAILRPKAGDPSGKQLEVPKEEEQKNPIKTLMAESNPTTRAYVSGIPMPKAAAMGHSTDAVLKPKVGDPAAKQASAPKEDDQKSPVQEMALSPQDVKKAIPQNKAEIAAKEAERIKRFTELVGEFEAIIDGMLKKKTEMNLKIDDVGLMSMLPPPPSTVCKNEITNIFKATNKAWPDVFKELKDKYSKVGWSVEVKGNSIEMWHDDPTPQTESKTAALPKELVGATLISKGDKGSEFKVSASKIAEIDAAVFKRFHVGFLDAEDEEFYEKCKVHQNKTKIPYLKSGDQARFFVSANTFELLAESASHADDLTLRTEGKAAAAPKELVGATLISKGDKGSEFKTSASKITEIDAAVSKRFYVGFFDAEDEAFYEKFKANPDRTRVPYLKSGDQVRFFVPANILERLSEGVSQADEYVGKLFEGGGEDAGIEVDDGGDGPVARKVNQQTLADAVGRKVFCPYTKKSLDASKSVLVSITKPGEDIGDVVMCAEFWDANRAKAIANAAKSGATKITILDGRKLFGGTKGPGGGKRKGDVVKAEGMTSISGVGLPDGEYIVEGVQGNLSVLRAEGGERSYVVAMNERAATKWSAKVHPSWKAPEGLFDKSAEEIASVVGDASKNLRQATSRIIFYMNRAGDNLGADDRKKLEKAVDIVRSRFGSKSHPQVAEALRAFPASFGLNLIGNEVVVYGEQASAAMKISIDEAGEPYVVEGAVFAGGRAFSDVDLNSLAKATPDGKSLAEAIVGAMTEAAAAAPGSGSDWLREFPGFKDMPKEITDLVKSKKLRDSSYHNDTCPSFEFGEDAGDGEHLRYSLAVYEEKPEDREDEGDHGRFVISKWDGHNFGDDVLATDDLKAALAKISELSPVVTEQLRQDITAAGWWINEHTGRVGIAREDDPASFNVFESSDEIKLIAKKIAEQRELGPHHAILAAIAENMHLQDPVGPVTLDEAFELCSETVETDNRYVDARDTAKEIRAVLADKFKGTKFSVKTKRSSRSESVSISWTDGPTSKAVSRAVEHLKGISSDPSDDSEVYKPTLTAGKGGDLVKRQHVAYINTHRSLSDGFVEKVSKTLPDGTENLEVRRKANVIDADSMKSESREFSARVVSEQTASGPVDNVYVPDTAAPAVKDWAKKKGVVVGFEKDQAGGGNKVRMNRQAQQSFIKDFTS